MKKNKLIFLLAAGVLILGVAVFLYGIIRSSSRLEAQETNSQNDVDTWTCVMHPEIKSDKPGKCPLCNSKLVPVQKETQRLIFQSEPAKVAPAQNEYYGCGVKEEINCPICDQGSEGKQCICKDHSFYVMDGSLGSCPVCKKPLVKLEPQDLGVGVALFSRLHLAKKQVESLAIKTQAITYRKLTKQIKITGIISSDVTPADPQKDQANTGFLENRVFVHTAIADSDLSWIRQNQKAMITAKSYPEEEFLGKVKSIEPMLDQKTKTGKIILAVDNTDNKLNPDMQVDVVIDSFYQGSDGSEKVLAAPKDAVLDMGSVKIVYVDKGNGIFVGKAVSLGPQASADVEGKYLSFYPILRGLNEGEIVVIKGEFLTNLQSQLADKSTEAKGVVAQKEAEKPGVENSVNAGTAQQ